MPDRRYAPVHRAHCPSTETGQPFAGALPRINLLLAHVIVLQQFSCDECGKCCRSNWALKSHRRRHTAEKPFSCVVDGCCKSFRTSGDRLRHLRVHSGLKNYGCDVVGCAASFTTSANLRTHKSVVHEGEFTVQF